MFIIEEETEKPEKKESNLHPSEDKNSPVGKSSYNKTVTKSNESTSTSIDNKIVDKLLKAIDDNNLEGFDYLEFKKSLKALNSMALDEETKYKSAFATASTMGVTVNKLLDTVKHYLGVLETENKTFNNTFKNQFNQKISQKEKEIAQREEEINQRKKEIDRLNQEIQKSLTEIQTSRAKLVDTRQSLESTQNVFQSSYDFLTNQINEDVRKIEKYLKTESNS